jgi:hypothetical protein
VNFSFLFWRLLLVNYIFYFQIIVQLKVLIVVPARTLIIKIDCIRFWSFSIRLEMFSFWPIMLYSLSGWQDWTLICSRTCHIFRNRLRIQTSSYFWRFKTAFDCFDLMMLSYFLFRCIDTGLWVWSFNRKRNFLSRTLVYPFDERRFFSLNHRNLLLNKGASLSVNEGIT